MARKTDEDQNMQRRDAFGRDEGQDPVISSEYRRPPAQRLLELGHLIPWGEPNSQLVDCDPSHCEEDGARSGRIPVNSRHETEGGGPSQDGYVSLLTAFLIP